MNGVLENVRKDMSVQRGLGLCFLVDTAEAVTVGVREYGSLDSVVARGGGDLEGEIDNSRTETGLAD